MAEQTFRSPGFFEQEIDLSAPQIIQSSIPPAAVIGAAQRGPAFVPVTVSSLQDWKSVFGNLSAERFGPYAVKEWLNNRPTVTYVRLLGAGANETTGDMQNTDSLGIVRNAGFKISGTISSDATKAGVQGQVQIIVATHAPPSNETAGYPIFSDNDSFFVDRDADVEDVRLVRGMVLMATGTRMLLADNDEFYSSLGSEANTAEVGAIGLSALSKSKYFKIILSSSAEPFGNDEDKVGIRILSASLDPADGAYISKVLNTDPLRFQQEQHLLYADFAVEHDLAPVKSSAGVATVAVVSGSSSSSSNGSTTVTFAALFGRFDTRYQTPRTTKFISQPFGEKEFDLFHFETLADGANAAATYKVSIANIRASTDPGSAYGTFTVEVRNFDDSDTGVQIVESFPNVNLDPTSDRYIAKQVGDRKIYYDFDQENQDERRLVVTGKYPNMSRLVRIQVNEQIERKMVPAEVLPFGFRGLPVLKTSNTLTDSAMAALSGSDGIAIGDGTSVRLGLTGATGLTLALSGAILPPVPMTFKVTKGAVLNTTSPSFVGAPGGNEISDARFYWGIKTISLPVSSSTSADGIDDAILRSNAGSTTNPLLATYTKFLGIQKMDSLVTGTGADVFCNNKFTLARVAFSNTGATLSGLPTVFTGTANTHMREAAYIRNGVPDRNLYTINDGTLADRYTLASLLATSSVIFNRFTPYAKFTNIFYGGFDGVNILDRDAYYFTDKAASDDSGGKAIADANPDVGIGVVGTNPMGEGRLNNAIASMQRAVDIITSPFTTRMNLLAIPGIRDPIITNHALTKVRDYQRAMYVMDIPNYDEDSNRLFDDSTARPDVRETKEAFEGRRINNNYGAVFFPDVVIEDNENNNRKVSVPASVAAMGALSFNDAIKAPWFAPAGFNRGSLDFVSNIDIRLSSADRDSLYDANINPIAVFPSHGFVIFGQKTLQQAQSALDRINVRRLLLEIKREAADVGNKMLFEPNNANTRARLIADLAPRLALIQAGQGLDSFQIVCDTTNNSSADVEANRLNARVIVVPTRSIEFIAIDFIITNTTTFAE